MKCWIYWFNEVKNAEYGENVFGWAFEKMFLFPKHISGKNGLIVTWSIILLKKQSRVNEIITALPPPPPPQKYYTCLTLTDSISPCYYTFCKLVFFRVRRIWSYPHANLRLISNKLLLSLLLLLLTRKRNSEAFKYKRIEHSQLGHLNWSWIQIARSFVT